MRQSFDYREKRVGDGELRERERGRKLGDYQFGSISTYNCRTASPRLAKGKTLDEQLDGTPSGGRFKHPPPAAGGGDRKHQRHAGKALTSAIWVIS